MLNDKHKILIVEDEPLIAEGIAFHLKDSIFSVTAIAYDAEDAFRLLQISSPDIALLDINLNGDMDGIQVAEFINRVCAIPFIYLTSYSDKAILDRAKSTIPSGFIVKPFNRNTLLASLEIAVSNFTLHNSHHVPEISSGKINKFLPDPLSEREFEILQWLYKGRTNQDICDGLYISMNTVKRHITNIYFKLDVKGRTEAIAFIRDLMLK